MSQQRLTSIEIEGFTSIRSARVELGAMNVLIGANGAGKSNFVQAFELLGRISEDQLNLFVGRNGGASALINDSAYGQEIGLKLDAPPNFYTAYLAAAPDDELIFDEEVIENLQEGNPEPWSRTIGRGHRETRLGKASGKRDVGPEASHIIELLQGCRVYHFHDTSVDAPVKRLSPTADNLALRADAGNIAAMLLRLKESSDRADKAAYRRIVGAIRLVAPFFRDFVLRPDSTDRILLRWSRQGSDTIFSANQMSDGTLRFVCLATLLLQPELPALVVLDEPELGLHPMAIVQLADMLRSASTRSQVLIATQSVTLMNQFSAEDLIVVEQRDGNSVFTRPNTAALESWLDEYSLGELWEKNIIGGQPGSTGSVLDV
ncbi:chromosome segregation protein SMC [Amycolatopsis thailandensis]|uniref:Chromosome segregation protein SMC n=2 Tax=Amycolatopsis thailandensis TaxID=589330 RepID=A0A229SAK1_9PSEU|nr:AAA family ATPase [Amycolatopsis thailandensis]OXM55957.1 chromosome segregation protein SMC [Amycolatopsis thailandensis]